MLRDWIKPRISWGPIPSARHSVITWTQDERYMFVYGGEIDNPEAHELNSVYKLDTGSFTWSIITTQGEPPPLNSRIPCWATYAEGKVWNVAFTWIKPDNKNEVTGDPMRVISTCKCYVLDTSTWTWTNYNTTISFIPSHLWGNGLAYIEKKLYFFCGLNYNTQNNLAVASNLLTVLDTGNWTWTTNVTVSQPLPASLHPAWVVVDKVVYVIPGKYYPSGNPKAIYPTPRLYCFEPSYVASENALPVPRYIDQAVSSVSGALNIPESITGREGFSLLFAGNARISAIEQYKRSEKKDKKNPYLNHEDVVFGSDTGVDSWKNKFVLFGGSNVGFNSSLFNPFGTSFRDIWLYTHDHSDDTLKRKFKRIETEHMGPQRSFSGAQILRGKIFVFGGKFEGKSYNDLHIFKLDPSDCPPPIAKDKEVNLSFLGISLKEKENSQPIPKKEASSTLPSPPPPPPPEQKNKLSESSSLSESEEKKFHLKKISPSSSASMSASMSASSTADTTNIQQPDDSLTLSLLEKAINNKNFFPDVKFRLGKDHKFYAHKVILIGVSNVLKKRLESTERVSTQNRPSTKPQKKKKDTTKGKEKDTGKKGSSEEEKEEYSMWEGESYLETIALPEFWNPNIFSIFLRYFYVGELTVTSREEAKAIGEMAYEYLLDPLMKFCQSASTFPATYTLSDEERWIKFRKIVGKPTGSDVSFVFDRSRRLFGHKLFLSLFSQEFNEILQKNKRIKYIEVKPGITEKNFISYLRIIYTNYHRYTYNNSKDIVGLLEVGVIYKDKQLLSCLGSYNLINIDNVLKLKQIASQHGFNQLECDTSLYIQEHFDRLLRSQGIKECSQEIKKEITKLLLKPYEKWCYVCSWLEALWFSYYTENSEIKNIAIKELEPLINVENVVPILIASHTVGEKMLRNKCIDFLVENATNIEVFKRMKENADIDMTKVGALSTSVRNNFTTKIKKRVSTLKEDMPAKPKTKVNIFNKKKHTCNLCKRIVDATDIRKDVDLPDIFGYTKPKQICSSCATLITLIPS